MTARSAASHRWLRLGVGAALAAVTISLWALAHQPIDAPGIVGRIHGAAYQPYRPGQSPTGAQPTLDEMDADLALLAHHMRAVRSYSSLGPLAELPRLAEAHGLNLLQGIWVDGDAVRSRNEIEAGVPAADRANVTGILVGNEAILRRDLTVAELARYLSEVRQRTHHPVSTAEPWGTWLDNPELAAHVDFIAIHILPYWEDTTTAEAVEYTIDKLRRVRERFPDKRMVLAEVGWPSDGRARWGLQPSLATEAQFVRRIIDYTQRNGIEAYLMEAFDGPWKYSIEGPVGPYWGLFGADRRLKFPLSGPITERPHWPLLAFATVIVGGILLAWLAARSPNRGRGALLQSGGGFAATLFAVWILDLTFSRYFTLPGAAMWALLLGLLMLLLVVLAGELAEFAGMLDRPPRERRGDAAPRPLPVSIHLPIHREPPAVVISTLRSLAPLDWPDFEVIVVDNNTPDAALWRPVEVECARLNAECSAERFRFVHVEGLAGFKAGALNLALRQTRPDAVAIGVIDADYAIDPTWLRRAMPEFEDGQVGFVQAPQDHRDIDVSAFKRIIGWEYAGFFHIGMVQRDLDNAIIQHGTMVLVRRQALDVIGGWAEWCITEDAELGLRLHEAGWTSVYVSDTLGRGLLPNDWRDYARQRHRWAYGGMRILKRNWWMFCPGSGLTARQRLRYAAGWLPWIGDALGLCLAGLAVVWTALAVLIPEYIQLPDPALFVPAMAAFGGRVILSFAAHRARVPCDFGESVRAAIAGVALAPTIGAAVLHGLVAPNAPFRRTPKVARKVRLTAALHDVRIEATLAAALILAAVLAVTLVPADPGMALWVGALLIQAVPPILAMVLALVSTAAPDQPELAVLPALELLEAAPPRL